MKYLVVANGTPPSFSLFSSLVALCQIVVAVDGGLSTCHQLGIMPDIIIGDFDSVQQDLLDSYSCKKIHALDQQKCDLEKALEYAFKHSASSVTVLGALGRRLDHTLTNICLLCRYPDKVKFETDDETCMSISSSYTLSCFPGQTISLIPLGTVTKIITQGFKWELNGADLSKNFVGISNIAEAGNVSIKFASGDLVVCLVKNTSKYVHST